MCSFPLFGVSIIGGSTDVYSNRSCSTKAAVRAPRTHGEARNRHTVEPLNNGHVGTRHFVLYKEVVLSSEVTNVLV